jgi:hypothetical protein
MPKTPKHSAIKEGSQKRDWSNSTSTRKDKKEKKRKSMNFERPAREEEEDDMQVDIPTEVSQKDKKKKNRREDSSDEDSDKEATPTIDKGKSKAIKIPETPINILATPIKVDNNSNEDLEALITAIDEAPKTHNKIVEAWRKEQSERRNKAKEKAESLGEWVNKEKLELKETKHPIPHYNYYIDVAIARGMVDRDTWKALLRSTKIGV